MPNRARLSTPEHECCVRYCLGTGLKKLTWRFTKKKTAGLAIVLRNTKKKKNHFGKYIDPPCSPALEFLAFSQGHPKAFGGSGHQARVCTQSEAVLADFRPRYHNWKQHFGSFWTLCNWPLLQATLHAGNRSPFCHLNVDPLQLKISQGAQKSSLGIKI